MNADRHRLNEVSEKIIGSAFHLHNNLGCGFLEKVYENALVIELRKAVKHIDEIHQAQLLNYLKATGLKLGLILNFGSPKLEIKRLVNKF